MFATILMLGTVFQERSVPDVPLPLLQAGLLQNAQLLKQYRVTYTQKIVLAEGARMIYRHDLATKTNLLQHTKDPDAKAQLERGIKNLQDRLQSFDAMRVEARHFDFRTDGQKSVLIWPWMDPAWKNVKDSWAFPDVPVTKESLEKEFKDLTLLVHDPKAERPFLFWVGAKRLNMHNAVIYPSYPTIGGLTFPPLTRAEFAAPEYRNPVDVTTRIKPEEVRHLRQADQPNLTTVLCISPEQNAARFCENEPRYEGRVKLRGENTITFDSAHGFLPVYMRITGRIYVDGRPVEGENGEYPSWLTELKITKIGKIGEANYPMETVEVEYTRDPQIFTNLSFDQRFGTKETLSPRVIEKTTTWTVQLAQTLGGELPKVELPENTYYVDTAASKSFVTGQPDDYVNSLIQALKPQPSAGWRLWTAAGLTFLVLLLAAYLLIRRFRPSLFRRNPDALRILPRSRVRVPATR